jgi:excinuclease UvrABC nuclease subunit
MYDIDFIKRGEYALHLKRFFLFPKFWEDPAKKLTEPGKWKKVKFTTANRARIPKESGIYCFVLQPKMHNFFETKYLFYIGKTNRTLWLRYKEYLNDQAGKGKPRAKIFEMFKQYSPYLHFYYTTIPIKNDIDSCEEKLLNTFIPRVNTDIPEAKISPELKNIYEI